MCEMIIYLCKMIFQAWVHRTKRGLPRPPKSLRVSSPHPGQRDIAAALIPLGLNPDPLNLFRVGFPRQKLAWQFHLNCRWALSLNLIAGTLGEREEKGGALSQFAFHPHLATVGLHDVLHD